MKNQLKKRKSKCFCNSLAKIRKFRINPKLKSFKFDFWHLYFIKFIDNKLKRSVPFIQHIKKTEKKQLWKTNCRKFSFSKGCVFVLIGHTTEEKGKTLAGPIVTGCISHNYRMANKVMVDKMNRMAFKWINNTKIGMNNDIFSRFFSIHLLGNFLVTRSTVFFRKRKDHILIHSNPYE